MACLSELAYFRFNPLFSSGNQKEWFLENISRLIDDGRKASLLKLTDTVAYDAEEERSILDDSLNSLRLELSATFDRGGTQAILVSADSFIALAFRGTEATSIRDIKSSVRANKRSCESGGKMHSGFYDAFENVWPMVEEAINETALDKVDLAETLVLVTADHSHVFTIAGYPVRGNPILGLVVENDITGEPSPEAAVDASGTPYTTLGYANGPGATPRQGQPRPVPEVDADAVYQAFVAIVHPRIDGSLDYSETHGGEDVALYGIGVGSERVGGVIEQNLVFDIMIQAFGWDDAI